MTHSQFMIYFPLWSRNPSDIPQKRYKIEAKLEKCVLRAHFRLLQLAEHIPSSLLPGLSRNGTQPVCYNHVI